MDFRKNFSERLCSLRKQKGVSLKKLGEYLGVTDEAIRLLEKGKRSPSFEILYSLANYFDVPVDYLLGNGIYGQLQSSPHLREVLAPRIEEQLGADLLQSLLGGASISRR